MTPKYNLFSCLSITGGLACSILFTGEALQLPDSYGASEFSGHGRTTYVRYDHEHHPEHKKTKPIMRHDRYQAAMRYLRKQKTDVVPSPVKINKTEINSQTPIIAYTAKDLSNDMRKYFAESPHQKRSGATID